MSNFVHIWSHKEVCDWPHPKNIAIDFDGTCVFNKYPEIGDVVPNCLETLRKILAKGHSIILFTARGKEEQLDEVIKWFEERDMPITIPKPEGNLKTRADLYIDDRSIGCPLILDFKLSKKPFVN